jgi:hypothetical protein
VMMNSPFCVHKVHVTFCFCFEIGFSQGNERTRSFRGQGDCCISFQILKKKKKKDHTSSGGSFGRIIRHHGGRARAHRRKRQSAGNVCRATSSSLLLYILNK